MSDQPTQPPAPAVSVIVPAFNAGATIERALRSVLEQDFADLEVIVVDDASRDDTVARAEAIGDNRVRILRRERNGGAAAATNSGIAAARGELIAFQDADDEWLAGKLGRQVEMIRADPDMSFVCTGLAHVYPRETVDDIAGFTPGDELWKDFLAATLVAKPCVLVRREALDQAGPFDESLPTAEDQDMWIRLALQGRVAELPEILVRAHRQPHSLSSRDPMAGSKHVLSMVQRHLVALGDRLTATERRHILGRRYSSAGRLCYGNGRYAAGAAYLAAAIVRGHRPVENFAYLMSASPPARWLKGIVRRG